MKIGLKLWSTNIEHLESAKKIYNKNLYDYLELYVVPNSYKNFINKWKALHVPYIVHASHTFHGINPAKKEFMKRNLSLAQESLRFSKSLSAEYVIFHPGINGDIRITIDFLNKIKANNLLIENKPYYALNGKLVCIGNSPSQIKEILDNTRVEFCLDVGHAICSANYYKIDYIKYIRSFIDLNPAIFHVSDGKSKSLYDQHMNFGKGDYRLKEIIKIIPKHSKITIETNKNPDNRLSDFVSDVDFFHNLLGDNA